MQKFNIFSKRKYMASEKWEESNHLRPRFRFALLRRCLKSSTPPAAPLRMTRAREQNAKKGFFYLRTPRLSSPGGASPSVILERSEES